MHGQKDICFSKLLTIDLSSDGMFCRHVLEFLRLFDAYEILFVAAWQLSGRVGALIANRWADGPLQFLKNAEDGHSRPRWLVPIDHYQP